jgi:lysophospholipase L1-like esterase
MPRSTFAFLVLLGTMTPPLLAGPLIDAMDEVRFRAPPGKGRAELVEGKVGKAVRFTFERDARSAFFAAGLRGGPEWDRAAGLSFWLKGDGSDSFMGLELIYDHDFAVRYDCCFSLRSKEWRKVTLAWRDFVPVLPGPRNKPLGGPGGNPPSKLSAVLIGKWWYWRDYPACSFALDELRLEDKIDADTKEYLPAEAPLARVRAKLRAGKPITLVTLGDSLTDFHHWANRKDAWPVLLKKHLEEKYRSKVTVVNPAIGGTQLRQGLILLPRWRDSHPEPDLVTICYGGNDWDAGMRGEQFRDTCIDAIDRVRRATKGTADVLLLTTVPSAKRWTDLAELAEACRAAAKSRKAGLADTERAFLAAGKDRKDLFAWDQVHLGPVGHELMARTVLEAIERAGEAAPADTSKPRR